MQIKWKEHDRTVPTCMDGATAYIEYDTMNRPVKYTYANGAVTTVEYNLDKLYTISYNPGRHQ